MDQRKIIHIDMDCFYAAIEVRDRPDLKGKPVAVGGSPEGRGVLTTANYEARKFGVGSAMPSSRAIKLCPDLVFIRPHFEKYRKASLEIREIFHQFTNLVQPLSLDEAYLDVSECEQFSGSATLIATEIRKQIFEKTKLTASAGIAPNKFLAKVASDWNKPNGQLTIKPSDIDQFMLKLPIKHIPGVGKVTQRKMKAMGIFTCKHLQNYSLPELESKFGKFGLRLYELSRGQDDKPVRTSSPRKSLSVENTYAEDLSSTDLILQKVPKLFEEFHRRFEKYEKDSQVKSSYIKLKFHDFSQTTMEDSQIRTPTLKDFKKLIELAHQKKLKPVRLIGIGVKLKVEEKTNKKTRQMSLFN